MNVDQAAGPSPFGELLRRHRIAAGLTQEDLAELAGLSRRGISDLERTARTHPYRETVKMLADALGLTGDERLAFFFAAKRPSGGVRPRKTNFARMPVPLSPLIGRHEEIAAVRHLLQDEAVRLVTLTGPGGVGKTRLAVAVAEQLRDSFRDGPVVVDLAPVRDPSLVLSAVAVSFGLRESADRAISDVIHGFLRDRELLLVLDNFEHVLTAAPFVADLLRAGPRVKALATSRAPLRLRGEREFPVPLLRLPTQEGGIDLNDLAATEAVALFVNRAQAVQPRFALTVDNAAAVSAICHRLDGLPLALELAAARVKILPPTTLLSRLNTRLPLLTEGPRDAPERQQTLRRTIAWSYDLLRPEARTLFQRLGLFVGGWTLEAAETIADLEGDLDVLEGLTSLADLSLIRMDEAEPEPRYGMLETIREFAAERLAASGEEAALRQAHADYFVALAERGKPFMYGAGQRLWLRRFEVELPNFRTALATLAENGDHDRYLRLTANLGLFWFLREHFAEGLAHLERALAVANAPNAHRAEALTALGRIMVGRGDFEAAERCFQQSEALARALDVREILWQALFQQGIVAAEWADDDRRAVSRFEAALAVARELGNGQAAGVALYSLGDAAYRRGDLEAAERLTVESVSLVRAAGDEWVLSLGLITLGTVALARGDTTAAVAAYREALDLGGGIRSDWTCANALAGFAAIAATQGNHTAAAHLLGATETLREASHQYRLANYVHHDQTTQAVRAALSESAFAAAWEAGRALSVDEAFDLPEVYGLLAEQSPGTR